MAKRRKQKWIWDDLPEPFRTIVQYIVIYGLAIYLIYAFLPTMWELGFLTTVGFIVSCGLSLYRKVVLRDPRVIGLIAVGYILSNMAMKEILPMMYGDILKQSFLTATIIGIVFLTIYLKSKELKDAGTK